MAVTGSPKATDLVKSHLAEAVKQYIVYDVSGRMIEVYSARTDAEHGESCGKTEYGYDAATTRVIKMKESLSAWDSSWDL
jgi:hypothetical protein